MELCHLGVVSTQPNNQIMGLKFIEQELQNSLSAFDAKVTNTITGGSLLPTRIANTLLQPYQNSVSGRPYTFTDNTATKVTIGVDYTQTSMNSLTRSFTGINWKIYSGDKFSYNYTYDYRAGNTTYNDYLLYSDDTNINISSFSGSIDISQFTGKTISSVVFYRTGRQNINFKYRKIGTLFYKDREIN